MWGDSDIDQFTHSFQTQERSTLLVRSTQTSLYPYTGPRLSRPQLKDRGIASRDRQRTGWVKNARYLPKPPQLDSMRLKVRLNVGKASANTRGTGLKFTHFLQLRVTCTLFFSAKSLSVDRTSTESPSAPKQMYMSFVRQAWNYLE